MKELTRGRLLLLGIGSTLAVIGLALVLARLAGVFDWQGMAVTGLLLMALLYSILMVQPGSDLPGFADASEIYIESIARSASDQNLTEFRPSTIRIVWLWAVIPPVLAIFGLALFI